MSLAIGISRLTALSPSCLQSRCCQHSVGMWGGLPCVLPFWGALSVSVSGVTAWGRHGVGWGTWCQAPFSRCGVLSPFQSRQMACSGPRVWVYAHACVYIHSTAGRKGTQGHRGKSAQVEARVVDFLCYSLHAPSYILEELIYIFFSPSF